MKDKIIGHIGWILFAFAIGFFLHVGTNTAKLIWPIPPYQYELTVIE